MTAPFSQLGGLKWDASYVGWYVTWPFARLTISEGSFEVRVRVPIFFSRCYTYALNEVRLTAVGPEGYPQGLRIESEAAIHPRRVTFKTLDLAAIVAALHRLGYPVTAYRDSLAPSA